jgi:lipoyl(octanoyl) transferase
LNPLFAELFVIDDPTPRAGPINMAIDEVLLRTTPGALLRFYRWSKASVSFGYFDRFEEAREFAVGRALVRRWTGGGIVPHGDDLTYSLMISATDAAYRLSSPALYREIHEVIARALFSWGVPTQLVQENSMRISAVCFANPVTADLLEGERKIAGAAHRRTRQGLLHQGSIQRPDLDERFRQKLASALSAKSETETMASSVLEAAEELAAVRYQADDWLRRR